MRPSQRRIAVNSHFHEKYAKGVALKVAAPPADLGTRISQYRCCLPALAEFST